jgi:UDP-N-acetylmuramate--alanine ligase
MDADHLDIYGTSDAIKESFVEFANKVKIKVDYIRNCR